MSAQFDVKNFQILTPGLHTGDELKFHVAYTIENLRWPWPPPAWRIKIEFEFNGLRGYIIDDLSGGHGGKASREVTLAGVMPRQPHIAGTVRFRGAHWVGFPPLPPIDAFLATFEERQHMIPNLDDLTQPPYDPEPPYEPPTVCIPGATKCVGHDLYECRQGAWILKERNSKQCGWVPEPVIPPGIPAWFERNKALIIGIAVAVMVVAIIIVVGKVGVRSPVTGWQPPVYRR